MIRRVTVQWVSALLGLVGLVVVGVPGRAAAQCARNDASCACPQPPYACKLDGSDLCTAVVGVTSNPVALSSIVRIQNKYRINTPFLENAKLLFSSRFTYNPPNPPPGRGYTLDAFYDRASSIGFWLDNSDWYDAAVGRTSLQSSTSMFQSQLLTIDCGDLPRIRANVQTDISGKDLVIDYVKGTTFTQTSGWPACQIQAGDQSCPYMCTATTLPPGTYQTWTATVTFDGVAYPVTLAMPADTADPGLIPAFIDPSRLFNFRTEFFETPDFVQFLLWDMKVQTQGSNTWVPVTQFTQNEPFGTTYNSSGARLTVYNNRPVLEISNDGSDTYHFLNDQFSIPADVSGVPSPEPRIEFTDNINWVYTDESSLKLVAKLDRTSTSPVTVSLKITGTAGATSYINQSFPVTLTVPAGSLTGSVSFPLSGTFPSGTDSATIYMTRSCNGMIGTVPAEKVTFVGFPRRPHVTQKYDFGVQGPFTNYDVFTTINAAPSQDFSPLMQYNFEAGVGGKIGLHLNGGQKYAEFTALDLSPTATSSPSTASCQRFGTSGTGGTSCSIAYSWATGREYRLRIAPLGSDNRDWRATVLDMETAAEMEIGRVHLTDAAPYTGFGGLLDDSKRPNGFLDWYGSTNACGTFAATSVTWRGPYASDGRYNPVRAEVVYGGGSCPESNGSAAQCPVFTADLGGSTTRTVAEGTNVWASTPCSSSTLTNDDFNNAKLVTTLPYGDEVNTSTATQAADDPTTSGSDCGASKHSGSVWYKYTPAANQVVRVSAVGSGYGTIVAVWTGTRGSLTQAACNHLNTNNAGSESELDVGLTGGTTYYFELAGYQTTAGGVGAIRIYPSPLCGS